MYDQTSMKVFIYDSDSRALYLSARQQSSLTKPHICANSGIQLKRRWKHSLSMLAQFTEDMSSTDRSSAAPF